MTRAQLVQELALRTGVHPSLAEHLYDTLLEILGDALCQGEVAPLGHLGRLRVSLQPPHPGRNPQTGERIRIPAHSNVRFHVAKAFRERLECSTLPAADRQPWLPANEKA